MIDVPLPNPKDGTLVHIRYDNMKASHSSTFGKTKVYPPAGRVKWDLSSFSAYH